MAGRRKQCNDAFGTNGEPCMTRFVLLGATVLSLAGASFALAQGSGVALAPDDIIASRQALMDLQQGNAATMLAGVKAGEDVKQYVAAAKGLISSAKVIPVLFPKGTESGHNTKAKAEVWSDNAGFVKAADNLAAQAEKLAALADANDKAGFATQFQATGQACGACHRQYRNQ